MTKLTKINSNTLIRVRVIARSISVKEVALKRMKDSGLTGGLYPSLAASIEELKSQLKELGAEGFVLDD